MPMIILLDECVPKRLRREFVGYNVKTVSELGWAGKKNGELLRLIMANKFDVFVTVDQNLRYQQQIASTSLSIVVLIAFKNNLSNLIPLMPHVLEYLALESD